MLKRTGFKRPTVERRALPPPVPVRRVAATVFAAGEWPKTLPPYESNQPLAQ